MENITIIDAPSNLGLSRPAGRDQPGCYLLPDSLRAEGIVERCGAHNGGTLTAPTYTDISWSPGTDVVRGDLIASYTQKLAKQITRQWDRNSFPLILGGDCSIILGPALAMRHRGRYGLVALDGPDFRHPGNSTRVGTAAGESLALATGRGHDTLSNIDHLSPYIADEDVVLIGMRDDDDFRDEVEATFTSLRASTVSGNGTQSAVRNARWHLSGVDGFWLHLDADVLDPSIMPAVDTPEPNGLTWTQLRDLLTGLLSSPGCIGMDVTILDPLLDPDGNAVSELTNVIVGAINANHVPR